MEQYVRDGGGGSASKYVFFILFAAAFAADAFLVVTNRTLAFDERILEIFFALREDWLTTAFRMVTFAGAPKVMLALCVILIILPGRLKVGLPVAVMTGLGAFIQTLLKAAIARPRPDAAAWLTQETGFSFPSGHAAASMIFWAALLILVGRVLFLQDNWFAAGLLRIVFALFAVLVGLSRLYLGVHYPSDVLGGWALAGALLILFFSFYDNVWPFKWRVSYAAPAWDAIPRNAEKRRGWKRPSKKRAPSELIQFPKKRGAWKLPKPKDSGA